jgi:hypothetical protein
MKSDFMRSNFPVVATLGFLGFMFALSPNGARAGVASDDTVLLDPFDPVPEIQFRHFGGNGCFWACAQHCWHACRSGGARIRRFDRDAPNAIIASSKETTGAFAMTIGFFRSKWTTT